MKSRMRVLARIQLPLVFLAASAFAAVLSWAFARDAISPAEARSATPTKQVSLPSSGVSAQVRIEALATRRNGITGRPRVQDIRVLTVGEPAITLLQGGDQRRPSVCSATFVDPSMDVAYVFLWKLEVKVVSVVADQTTLEVHWVRSRNVGGQPALEKDEVRSMTLGPADSHVLDYVEDPADPPSSCASLLVRVSAQPIEQQKARTLAVDVWTVDESSAGATRSVHEHVEGPTGQPVAYHLPPLKFAPAGVGAARESLTMDVHGTFQAVVSEGGFVDVSLSAVRRTSSPRAEIQGEGRVQFRAKIGETAAVLLPEPAGNLPGPSATADPLDVRRLFSGRSMWLYVRVESVR